MANGMTPYGVSFIQTAAGAMITGEIKRYNTYKDMVTDPAPTRLASVSNASRDEDYPVDDDHKGGILFQRDFINSTWIKIYSDEDLALPTYIDWSHILNVPLWVGGVSNNRVKLNTHTYAVPRTTYYSYGPYRLILPPAEEVKLGEEIILEQYDSYGIVLYYIDPDRVPKPAYAQTKTDDSTGKTYCYIYTSPLYRFNLDGNGNVIYSTDGTPIASRTYRFIRTETDSGYPTWMLCLDQGDIDRVISELKKNEVNHSRALDPHPVYVRKDEVARYLTINVTSASHELNDAEIDIVPGTEEIEGTVYLSVYNKDFGTNADPNRPKNVVATVKDIRRYLAVNYALANHPHEYTDIRNVPLAKILDYTINGNVDYIHIVTTKLLADSLNGYALARHSHDIDDVDQLQENLDDINNRLDTKADIVHEHYLSDIVDYQDLILKYDEMTEGDNRTINPGYLLQHVSSIEDGYLAREWGIVDIAANLAEGSYDITDFKVKFQKIFNVKFEVINLTNSGDTFGHKDAFPQLLNYLTKNPGETGYTVWTTTSANGITGMRYLWNWTNSDYQDNGARLIWEITGIGTVNRDAVTTFNAFTIMYGFDRIGKNLTTRNFLKTGDTRTININRLEGITLNSILSVGVHRTRSFNSKYEEEADSTAVGRNGTLMLYGDVTKNTEFDPVAGEKYPFDIGLINVSFDNEKYWVSPFWAVYGQSSIEGVVPKAGYVTNGNARDNCLYIPEKYAKIENLGSYNLITIFLNATTSLFICCGQENQVTFNVKEITLPICSNYLNNGTPKYDLRIKSRHMSASTIVYDNTVRRLVPHWSPIVDDETNRRFGLYYWKYPSDTSDTRRCTPNDDKYTPLTSIKWQMHGIIESNSTDPINTDHLNAVIEHYDNYQISTDYHSYKRKYDANGMQEYVFVNNEKYYVWQGIDVSTTVYSKVKYPLKYMEKTISEGVTSKHAADLLYYNPVVSGGSIIEFSSNIKVTGTNATNGNKDSETKPFVGTSIRANLDSAHELIIFIGEFVQVAERAGVELLFPFEIPGSAIGVGRRIGFDITQMDYCVSIEATEAKNPFKYRLYDDSVSTSGLSIISMEKCDYGTNTPHPAAYTWMYAVIADRNQ